MIDDIVTHTLEFTIPLPPSVNSMYAAARNGRRFLSARAKGFKESAGWAAIEAANLADWRYQSGMRLRIVCTYFFGDAGVADLDNLLKLSIDAIKTALGFDDDHRVVIEVTARDGGIDRRNPRGEITLEVLL